MTLTVYHDGLVKEKNHVSFVGQTDSGRWDVYCSQEEVILFPKGERELKAKVQEVLITTKITERNA